jgi:hypothetical protein
MVAVKASAFDPFEFTRRFDAAARERGFRSEPLIEIAGVPLSAYTKRIPGPHPRIYVSSGIHGDEPATPGSLLHMLEKGLFDSRANWFLCPLLNPTGYVRGTRENDAGIDLNRDYRDLRSPEIAAHVRWLRRQPNFDITFCLHEDWGTEGFYLYELNPHQRPTLADAMIAAAMELGAIETSAVIDGRKAHAPGIIRPESDPLLREQWPEALYLLRHHCTLNYTLETPSVKPLEQRIATQHAAVAAAINTFLKS